VPNKLIRKILEAGVWALFGMSDTPLGQVELVGGSISIETLQSLT
jgi:hypothetical protein